MFATVVDMKGDGDKESARGLRRFITSTGYKRLELKTDGEPALEVARQIKEISEAEMVQKDPLTYEQNTNGLAERVVREFKEQLRATKLALERRIKSEISPKSPILLWMVVHAIETINRFLVGSDGRTPHYRLHGKEFKGSIVEFGEIVYAKPIKKASRKRSLKSRAVRGRWLIVRVRTMIRVPDSEK